MSKLCILSHKDCNVVLLKCPALQISGLLVWPLVLTSELGTRAYALQSHLSHRRQHLTPFLCVEGEMMDGTSWT